MESQLDIWIFIASYCLLFSYTIAMTSSFNWVEIPLIVILVSLTTVGMGAIAGISVLLIFGYPLSKVVALSAIVVLGIFLNND